VTATTRFLPARARVWLGLGSSFSRLQWIVDACALTLAASLLTADSLSDMYGRRLLFLIGLVVFTGASLLCGFAAGTGGVLTSGISWRWIFFVNGPAGAVAIVLSVLKVTGVDEAQLGHGDGSCVAGAGQPGSQTARSGTARPTPSSPGAATRAHRGLSRAVVVPNVDARPAHISSKGMRGAGSGAV
jgi:MFS family permease